MKPIIASRSRGNRSLLLLLVGEGILLVLVLAAAPLLIGSV